MPAQGLLSQCATNGCKASQQPQQGVQASRCAAPSTAPSATHPPRGRPPRRCGGRAQQRSCRTGHPPTGRQSTAARGGGGGAGCGSVSARWRWEQPYSLLVHAPSPRRAGSGLSHSHKRSGSRKTPKSSAWGNAPLHVGKTPAPRFGGAAQWAASPCWARWPAGGCRRRQPSARPRRWWRERSPASMFSVANGS